MDAHEVIRQRFRETIDLLERSSESLLEPIAQGGDLLIEALSGGGQVLVCGNGGSAADAQHLAAELTGRYQCERDGFPAIALTADSVALTAIANDYGYERVFARQVEALGRSGDALIVLSTSGDSPNVVAAVASAHRAGIKVVALVGGRGGKVAANLARDDVEIRVPSESIPRIQEVHALAVHLLCEQVETRLADRAEA